MPGKSCSFGMNLPRKPAMLAALLLALPLAALAQVPDAPFGVSATAGDKQVTVSWSYPFSGGSPITGYTVTASPGGATCSAADPEASCTVTGLENGTVYGFSVTATNGEGTGPASSPVSALPLEPYWGDVVVSLPGARSVAWDGTMWVVVGSGGNIRTSTNGIDWTTQVSGTSAPFYSVAGNGTMWVVVGNGGTLLTSTNGTDWVPRTSGTSTPLTSVAWNGSMWAVGTASGGVLTSLDGVNWTLGSTGGGGTMAGIAWNGSKWMAVVGASARASTDGVTWSSLPVPGNPILNGIAWNGSMWVAVGMRQQRGFIVTSTDGNVWDSVYTTPIVGDLQSVAWNGLEWQAVGAKGTYVSTDGVNWTPNGGGALQTMYGVAWGDGRYVVVGDNGARFAIPDALPEAPSNLAYPAEAYVFTTNTDTTVVPTFEGNVAKWTVSPALPKGLWLDAATGRIRGMALATAEEQEYVITGRNMAGAVTKTLLITVLPGQATPPSSPEQVTVTPGNKSATVTWVPGYDGGSPITGYTVSMSPGDDSCATDAETTECTFTGLEIGTQYTFTVTAANAEGVSPASDPAQITLGFWNPVTSGVGTQFNSVAWNGSMWVAVGQSAIRTSTDGINWVAAANIGGSGLLNSVAWNGSMWVAVGQGTIRTSTDGTNWTQRNPGGSALLNSVAWNGSMWVAVGQSAIRTSTDGINWVAAANIGGSGTFNSVAWNGSMWVAVGQNAIRTSTDGTNWTQRSPGGSGTFNSVAWNGSMWVAVGQGTIRRSTDGINWTTQSVGGAMNSVVWDGHRWQVVGANGTAYVSPNGVNWTPNNSGMGTGASATMMGLAWGNGRYVAVGNSGSIRTAIPDTLPAIPSGLDYGTDGLALKANVDTAIAPSLASGNAVKWTVSPALPNGLWLDAATGRVRGAATGAAEEQEYVITASNIAGSATKTLSITVLPGPPAAPGQVSASPGDGSMTITWAPGSSDGGAPVTAYTVTVSPGEGGCVVEAETTECVVTGLLKGESYTFAVTATNAHGTGPAAEVSAVLNVWHQQESDDLFTTMHGIVWNGSMWVSVGSGEIRTSTDGNDWILRASGTGVLYQVVWNGSMWVAVGPGGIFTSADGIDWGFRGGGNFFGVAWNGRMWVAVGANGLLRTSSDGFTWDNRPVEGNPSLQSAAWNGSKWLAVGANGAILTSTDGIVWTPSAPVSFPWNLYEVVWNGSRWVVTGQHVIITSTDGEVWEDAPLYGELYTLTWSGREWQALGPGASYVSTDGINWKSNNSGLGQTSGHAWGAGRYLAMGEIGSLYVSVPDTLPSAPTGLGYGGEVLVLVANADTTLAPTLAGNAVTWTVNPPLPAGLWLDAATGVIRGAATAVLAPTAYTVTARNMGGAATKVVTIAVESAGKPKGLAYEPASRSFPVGVELEPWAPTLESGEATSWSVSPELPPGLVFDPETGEIFGSPSELSPLQEYVVKAARGSDTASAVLQIEVVEVVSLRPEAFTIRVTGREKLYGFTIPAGVVGVDRVTVGILDIHGRTLWSASVKPKAGKAQEIVWNGRAKNGSLVSAGVYVVRVSVTGDGKTTHYARKTVSLKPGGR